MNIKPIKDEASYEAALQEIDRLFDPELDTPEGDRLEVLVTLVEAYEDKHYDLPPPDPIDALVYYLESRGLTESQLEPYIGTKASVSEQEFPSCFKYHGSTINLAPYVQVTVTQGK